MTLQRGEIGNTIAREAKQLRMIPCPSDDGFGIHQIIFGGDIVGAACDERYNSLCGGCALSRYQVVLICRAISQFFYLGGRVNVEAIDEDNCRTRFRNQMVLMQDLNALIM
ncbi:hypothetical protein [Robbsia andropogonis]|uniref:hypothetical protein n=1 Tax=Robbsia andropogonis TaxID=28092 RepID=UPI00138DD4D3|nr:hypothetical protein [Robbsia andropogonis]MCP1118189.1 hypothetical protein [Robbsia andropogonis]MCP1127530.1 hypothetical protein [Robbsia andropogonis]